MISVICPFYNEEEIIEASVDLMLKNLSELDEDWEMIIVNDGSTDNSLSLARDLERKYERLRVLSYEPNHGRGYAMRTGLDSARGDLIVTTEIDSSWGDDIVRRILDAFREHPGADMIVASPHLPGGGYKNVPPLRVFLSKFGNLVVRSGLSYKVTMNTGMTRGYRADKFVQLPLDEDGKEIHLEIISKALAFGYRIYEIPAVLEWKAHKLSAEPMTSVKRKSSARIQKLIRSHLLFSLIVAPFRHLLLLSSMLFLGGIVFMSLAIGNLGKPEPSIYYALTSFFLMGFSVLISGFALLAYQGRELARDLWRTRSETRELKSMLFGTRVQEAEEQ